AETGSPEAMYQALCEYVLAFLDNHLRGDVSRRQTLDATYRTTPLGGRLPHVEHVAIGETAARSYREAPDKPPEPRQLRGLLRERGAPATAELLKSIHGRHPNAPIFNESVGFAAIDDLLARGRTKDAIIIHRLYATFDPAFQTR